MRFAMIGLILLAASGCSQEEKPLAQAERDAAIAEVRAVNDTIPELEPVELEPILYPDIESEEIYGPSCAYAPGDSIGAVVIARQSDAFIKIDGDVLRIAPDAGSPILLQNTHAKYDGRANSLELSLGDLQGGSTMVQATIRLRDEWGRVVYEASGTTNCQG